MISYTPGRQGKVGVSEPNCLRIQLSIANLISAADINGIADFAGEYFAFLPLHALLPFCVVALPPEAITSTLSRKST